jgi:hypothetical protein
MPSSCADAADADAQFRRFLGAIADGTGRFGAEFFHAFPQAMKVDHVRRVPRFDAIGRLENLTEDLAVLRTHGLEVPLGNQTAVLATSKLRHHKRTPCQPSEGDGAAQRLVCELYAADYACFGYARPAACDGL